MKAIYLPSGYKKRSRTIVEGVAASGEVSEKGIVAHTESWDGRVAALAGPAALRFVWEHGRLRRMTFAEMVDRGYFVVGEGPKGVRRVKEGIDVVED